MSDQEIILEKINDLGDGVKEFREEMRGDMKIQRHETQQGFKAINERLGEHGERITKVETKITDLIPRVDNACSKANGATSAIAGLSGRWSTSWKILAAVMTGAILGGLGFALRALVGG